MKRIRLLLVNLIILTSTSILLRTIGLSFNVYISGKLGAAGMGLFQLISSMYYMFLTFALSGVRLGVTRLVAEEVGLGRNRGALRALKLSLTYALIFSTTACAALFFSAQPVGTGLLGDYRTVLSLRVLALTMPPLALSSVLCGYFSAVRSVIQPSAVHITEQLVKIGACVGFLSVLLPMGLEYACAAVALGMLVGEIISLILLALTGRIHTTRLSKNRLGLLSPPPFDPDAVIQTDKKIPEGKLLRRLLHIAVPVALSAYVTSAMRTVQQLLIPYGFKKSGATGEAALATYGTIQGMVFPLLMFPSVLLDAVAEIIVPELAECRARGDDKRLSYMVTRVFNLGLLCSVCVTFIFLRFSDSLGTQIYDSADASRYIRLLAPIIPIMYLDSIVDAMLKGVGQQVRSMRYNIAESVIGAGLLFLLLPRFAVNGYIFVLYFSRMFNFVLSAARLTKTAGLRVDLPSLGKSLFCIAGSISVCDIMFRLAGIQEGAMYAQIAVASLLYLILLRVLSCIKSEDIRWAKGIFSASK
ncbi:MAG: polysaccharide biosynthesis C-terminal domain-containing protein [Eubacteriales bacterium]